MTLSPSACTVQQPSFRTRNQNIRQIDILTSFMGMFTRLKLMFGNERASWVVVGTWVVWVVARVSLAARLESGEDDYQMGLGGR